MEADGAMGSIRQLGLPSIVRLYRTHAKSLFYHDHCDWAIADELPQLLP